MANKLKKKKVKPEMNHIRKAVGLYVGYGYIWFSKPFKWNPVKMEIETVEARWRNWIWYLNLTIVLTSTIAQTLSLALEYLRGEMVFAKFSTMWRLVQCGGCQVLTLMQIHTAFRNYEIKDFTNQCLRYLKILANEKILKNPQRFDKQFGLVLQALFAAGYMTVAIVSGSYLAKCKLHILSGALPICEDGHYGWHTIPYFLLVYHVCNQLFCAALCYLAMIIVSDFGCAAVLKRMREDPGPFPTSHSWIIHYKCLQLLFARMNDALGKYIFPTFLTIPVAIAITINYAFVVLDVDFILGFCGGAVNAGILIFITIVIGQASFFGDQSENLIREKGNAATANSNLWLRRVFKAMRKFQIEVGSFMILQKSTVFEVLEFILNTTIDVVLIDET